MLSIQHRSPFYEKFIVVILILLQHITFVIPARGSILRSDTQISVCIENQIIDDIFWACVIMTERSRFSKSAMRLELLVSRMKLDFYNLLSKFEEHSEKCHLSFETQKAASRCNLFFTMTSSIVKTQNNLLCENM